VWLVHLIEVVVLFAALAIVPLGLLAITLPARDGGMDALERPVRLAFPPTALLLLASFLWPRTTIAAAFGAAYVVACAGVALLAVRRLARRRRFCLEETAIDLGCLYLPVGGAWAFAYANGLTVMGFAGVQCLLTAAHFHYAGFGACVVAGLAGRALPAPRGAIRYLYVPAALGMMTGVALLAAGIAAYAPLERAAAWIVAASLLAMGAVLLVRAVRPGGLAGRAALALAGVGTLSSGTLAAWFSETGFARLGQNALRTMVLLHGVVNAVLFVGLALVGLLLLRPIGGRSAPTTTA
jgi:hypothetical protein